MKRVLHDPICLIFFTIGSLIILSALYLAWRDWRVSGWPQVAAEVVSSRSVKNAYSRYEGQVELQVDGERITLTTQDTTDPADIEEAISDWTPRTVLVLPQNPDDGKDLRLPRATIMVYLPLIVALGGLAFILVPIGVVALSERQDALQIVGALLLACGMLFVTVGILMSYQKVQVLKSWPEVEAVIVQSEVGRRSGNRRIHRGIDLVLEYPVDRQTVRAAVAQRATTMDVEAAERALSTTYAPGQKIWIRYQPSQPKRATFEAAWTFSYFWETLLFLGLGFCTAVLGGLIRRTLKA